MQIIIGESWSGNWLVYYPSRNRWEPRENNSLEPSTQDDIVKAQQQIDQQGLLILNVQFMEA